MSGRTHRPSKATAHQQNLIFRHPIKVLIAEDNIVNQIVVKGLFSHINANITIANTGIEALGLFEKSQANNEPYHLILMDCEMPDMDGYEATKKIRSYETSEQSNRTPIIALTAHVLEDQRKKCLAIGMDDRLSKPLKKDDLEKMILKYVQRDPSLAKPSQSG